jgi:hypothetical protein
MCGAGSTLSDSDHPEELVDIIARVADHAAEDDENVVHAKPLHNLVSTGLVRGHGFADLDQGRQSTSANQRRKDCSPADSRQSHFFHTLPLLTIAM